MTPSEKREYALSLCRELYSLVDAHNGIVIEFTDALNNFEMGWRERILFFLTKLTARKGIQSDMKLVKTIEHEKSRLITDGEDVKEYKVDEFIVDLKKCIADKKHHIHQTKTQLARLQKP